MAKVDIKINLITKAAEAELQRLRTQMEQTANGAQQFGKKGTKSVNTLSRSFRNASIAFGSFGVLLRAGLVGGGLFGLSKLITAIVKDFGDFESALIGVGKTTNLEGRELAQFGVQIQKLSTRIPLAATELLDLAKVAAQLGVRGTANLEKFAEVGARLAAATNLGAEEAVTSLTRIIGVTGGSIADVDKLGAALVQLGNTFKAQEDEILTAASRVARGTAGFGLAAEDTLAIGAALKEAGVEAESGGSAVARVFAEIDKALAAGGQQLEVFTRVTGLTAEELKENFAKDAAGTFNLFIQGLDRSRKSGENLTQTLKGLSLDSIRVAATLRPLATISDRVSTAFDTSSTAVKENTALNVESDKQFASVNSTLITFGNTIRNIFIDIGKINEGPLKDFIVGSAKLAEEFRGLIKTTPEEQIKRYKTELTAAREEVDKLSESTERTGGIFQKVAGFFGRDPQLDLARVRVQELESKIKSLQDTLGITEGNQFVGPPEPEAGDRVPASEDPRVKKENEIVLLIEEIRAAAEQRRQESLEEIALTDELKKSESFAKLEETLGAEVAAQTATDALKLIQQKKFVEARDLINKQADKADANRLKAKNAAELQVERQKQAATLSIVGNTFALGAALAKDGSKAQFLIQKAGALATTIIQGQVALANAAALPFGAGLPLIPLIKANTALQVATIAATAIKGFQDGGVVGGSSFSGDNVLARVNSGEMILNRNQQSELFKLAQGSGGSTGTKEFSFNITTELDGEVVARSVSKQVANGVNLGDFE